MLRLIAVVFCLAFATSSWAHRLEDIEMARNQVDKVWETIREVTGVNGTDRASMVRMFDLAESGLDKKKSRLCKDVVFPSRVKGRQLFYRFISYKTGAENPTGLFWGISIFWPDESGEHADGMVRLYYEQSYDGNIPLGSPKFHVDFRYPDWKVKGPDRLKSLMAPNGEWGFPGEERTWPKLERNNEAPIWLNALYILVNLKPERFAQWCSLRDNETENPG